MMMMVVVVVLGSQPAGNIGHELCCRLPLPFARTAVTFPIAGRGTAVNYTINHYCIQIQVIFRPRVG